MENKQKVAWVAEERPVHNTYLTYQPGVGVGVKKMYNVGTEEKAQVQRLQPTPFPTK